MFGGAEKIRSGIHGDCLIAHPVCLNIVESCRAEHPVVVAGDGKTDINLVIHGDVGRSDLRPAGAVGGFVSGKSIVVSGQLQPDGVSEAPKGSMSAGASSCGSALEC